VEAPQPEPIGRRGHLVLEGPLAVAAIAIGVVVGAAGNFLVIALVVALSFTAAVVVRIWAVDRDRRPIVPAWSLAAMGFAAIGFGLIRSFGLVFGLLALLVVVVAFVIFGSDIG
jgi:hypothetical protein